MDNLTIGFIGLGLIGGSIARVLKAKHPDYTFIAFSRSRAPLEEALSDGVLDEIIPAVDTSFSVCDYIFLCTPVEYNSMYLEKLKPLIKDTCIITDVGSVKGYIHHSVIELDMEANFIGGHPMAGSEKTGYHNSSTLLLENAYYAVTPTAKTKKEDLDNYVALVKDTGAIPVVIDYEKHDYSVAGISHLPHLIASSLVNLIKDNDSADGTMKMMAAGGFKDITRIASSSPEMWQQICMTNPFAISKMLELYIRSLTDIKDMIDHQDKDGIYNLFDTSREYRNSIQTPIKGSIPPAYNIYCDIADEEGAIALVASILAFKHINIKNISIVHNREFEHGILIIEFYEEDAMNNAMAVLNERGYNAFTKN